MSIRLWRHRAWALAACISCLLPAVAQFATWETFVEQLHTEYEERGQAAFESVYEGYAFLHANPININRADSTELESLGFLSPQQIAGIHQYISRHGALQTLGELMLIPELDYHTRQLLSYFVTFGPLSQTKPTPRAQWHRMLTQGRSELSTRLDIPCYQRAGYAPRTPSQQAAAPSRYYLGNALYHNLRYHYRYGSQLSWGIGAEKDAGEPIFTAAQPLPDYLSGYLQIGNKGIMKNLVIGNYRLHFGQGLVINSDFALSKTMLLQGLNQPSSTIKPHRGLAEANYYTGAAATWSWKAWELTTFASHRPIDATLNGEAISSLKTDGYHRTSLEQARRGNTRSTLFGAHLRYAAHGFHGGLTAMRQSFSRPFAPSTKPYQKYATQRHAFTNVSIDYAWHHHRLSLSGETAIDGQGALATLNVLRVKAIDRLYLTLLQRHYAHNYWGLEARSFSVSSDARNEQGIYLGADWQLSTRLQVSAYADVYHFPFLRYQVSAPSYGTDGNITIRYAKERDNLMLRYRYRLKQRDVSEGYRLSNGVLLNEWTHRLRLQWEHRFTSLLSVGAHAEGCLSLAETLSVGHMANIQVSYAPHFGNHDLRLSSGLAAFDADYAARLYGYERGLLYAYNYHTYHGRGLRGYLLLHYGHKSQPSLTATAKIGATHYADRQTIGSGANAIDANHQEDLQLQIRYTF